MTDKRDSSRQRTLLTGLVVFGGGSRSLGCAIRDLSASGARIELAGPEPLPRSIWLVEVRSGMAHDCRIAWTEGRQHGVQFLSSTDLHQVEGAEMTALRRLWMAFGPR